MNCLWIILLLFGCGNNWSRNGSCGCGCGNDHGRDRDCGCDNDYGRDRDCGCDNDYGRDRDCDYDSSVRSSRYPNVSRSSETCGCEKSDESEA